MRSHTYEITFTGEAGSALRTEFDDCEVTVGPGTTTLRAELPDQCALSGLIQRVIDLRLEITRVLLLSPPRPDHHANNYPPRSWPRPGGP